VSKFVAPLWTAQCRRPPRHFDAVATRAGQVGFAKL
jgi:hypothetical protein